MRKKTKNSPKGISSFSGPVFNIFLSDPFHGFNFRQLSHKLGIKDKSLRQEVAGVLEELRQSGQIIETKRGKYQLNPVHMSRAVSGNTVEGTVDMKSTGKAYISTGDFPEDIYIAQGNTFIALHGDRVKVHLFPKRKGKKLEGRIIEVVKRAKENFTGILQISREFAFLIPDNPNMPVDIFIPADKLNGAVNGQKVIARMTGWPEHSKNPVGEVTGILGEPGEHNTEMNSILADFGFPLSFDEKTTGEAKKIPVRISPGEIAKRRDFRGVFTCTIDPVDAKDFDDALSLTELPDGRYEVGVHIADVSHYVKKGTALDHEAYSRGTSVYLVDRVIPMLPEVISNEICSLRPGEDKLCFSAVFTLDKEAHIGEEWFGKTVIRSGRRYHYEEVQDIIEGKNGDPYQRQIMVLHNLALKLREERFRNGSIAFTTQEIRFELDETGKPLRAYVKKQTDSNRLIEDFMLLANRRVAEKVGKKGEGHPDSSFVYRIHDAPDPEKFRIFANFVSRLGYKLTLGSRKTTASSLNNLFGNIAGKGEENLIETIAVRTMAKAVYSTENIGHYGLAFSHYTHFTSPIRRYPDLMVHRLLQDHLLKKRTAMEQDLEERCKHSSEMERRAQEAERASVKFKQVEYFMDKVGNEFTGIISGVSKWGLFVELDVNKGEGLVPIKSLDDDFYFLDEENYRMIGQYHRNIYRIGDTIAVKVRSLDLSKKQMELEVSQKTSGKSR